MLLVRAPVDAVPDVDFAPDQPPEAVHVVAFVEVQVSVDDPPLVTVAGFAANETVGTDGGGMEPETVIPTDSVALPPTPAHVKE